MTSQIQGYDALMKQLHDIENIDLQAATVKGLTVIKDESQSNSPVDTGDLQSNQFVVPVGDGAVINIEMPYAIFQEFGTSYQAGQPFIRPAIDSKSNEALHVIADDVEKQIKARI